MYNGELVEIMLKSSKLTRDKIILAFAGGSSQHGARIEGKSDLDVAGVYIDTPLAELGIGNEDPRKKGHVTTGSADQYDKNTADDTDIKAYTLRRWAGLAMKGNPVILSYLFVPEANLDHAITIGKMECPYDEQQCEYPRCLSHTIARNSRCVANKAKTGSVWNKYILPNRDLFAASGHAAAFLGLGDAQYKRMLGIKGSGKHGQRPELIAEHGYDCYLDAETEFLTNQGWKKFDEVGDSDLLASFDLGTGEVRFEPPMSRIDNVYSGELYIVEPQLTRCVVTPGHSMSVSPASRSRQTGFSTEYFIEKAKWDLIPLSDLMSGVKTRVVRSMYHIRRSAAPRNTGFGVENEYLKLGGMFLSEGSISFRKGRVKDARLVQTPEGKQEYYGHADPLVSRLGGHRYDYPREHVEFETIWTLPRNVAERLYADFGHHKDKHLPDWAFNLSYDQAWEMWNGMCLGDGTRTKTKRGSGQGTVLYTSVKKLADDVHAMMVSSGHVCVMNGPYDYDREDYMYKDTRFKNTPMYQVYRPDDQDQFRCVNFKSGILKSGQEPKQKYGYPVKEVLVENHRVVCFEMPSGTLITRSQGKPAFQGNCKAAMHMIRSMSECLEFLKTGYMTFPRPDKDMLLTIRAGSWGLESIKKEYNRLREEVQAAEKTSPLPPKCDPEAINKIVVEAMIHHWKTQGAI